MQMQGELALTTDTRERGVLGAEASQALLEEVTLLRNQVKQIVPENKVQRSFRVRNWFGNTATLTS